MSSGTVLCGRRPRWRWCCFHVSALSQETWGLDPARVDHVGAAGVDLFFVISGFIMAMIVGRPGAVRRP
jgi:peptidoglycan/LPS O-acetylase OafA/YrhL